MKNILRKILYAGIKPDLSLAIRRTIILTNAIALIAMTVCILLLPYLLITRMWKWTLASEMTIVTTGVLFLILAFNKFQLFNISRFLLSILLPVMSMLVMMLPRIGDPSLYHYLPRSPGLFCMVLATSVVPLMVFSTREGKFMFPALGLNVLILMSIDPVLYIFSADSKMSDYTIGHFISSNIIIILSEFFILGSTLFLKVLFEYFEKENEFLISNLNKKNVELKDRNQDLFNLNQNIETQNEEIQAQSEELMQSQESLLVANEEIDRQKKELEAKNILLQQTLDAKRKALFNTNQQLVVHNHELQQFSHSISHNLRGPLASMLGLLHLHNLSTDATDKARIFSLLEKSVYALETVILDLSKIMDIRKNKFNVIEKVNLEEEVDQILKSLDEFIVENDVRVTLDLQVAEIISVKVYINSILYNLISNAIQYRSPNRRLQLNISSHKELNFVVIGVSDNGLGIDLDRFKGDLFKLYKRFHTHTEGKGLGLYIVKLQVDKLNGHIEVESQQDKGTRFSVFLVDSLNEG